MYSVSLTPAHELMHGSLKEKTGFTLTELAVALVIIATLTGMSISATLPILQQARINATTKKMAAIEQALLNYSIKTGRIPCPGDLTITPGSANYGQEAGYAVGGVGTGECVNGMTPAANFRAASGAAEGGIPTAALGLPYDFMYDGWGNRFRYVVDPSYTTSAAASSRPFPNNMCVTSTSSITVNDVNGVARTTKGVYAIISHGANGHGAYTQSGVTFNGGSLNTDEQTNCHCDATGAHTGGAGVLSSPTYVQETEGYQTGHTGQPLYYFDDIVTYKENWQMLTASNLAPTTCPYIWVADEGNNRVLKLDTRGNFIQGFGASYNGVGGSVGTSGSSDQKLSHPMTAITDSSGNLWVADGGNNRIVELNSNGQWLMTIGGNTTTDTCAGTYATSTTCNKLTGYTNCCAPNAATCTCSSGAANGQFNVSGVSSPQQIAFDTSGNLWATDYSNNRVQEFNTGTGAYMTSFSVGNCPSGLTIDNNNVIWVSSDCSKHVQKCTTGGSCTTINPPTLGSNWASNYITVDPNSGNIWANDQGGTVYEFNSSGTYLGTLSNSHSTNLEGLFFDSSGYIWVADDNAHNIYKINPATGNLLLTIGTGTSGTGTSPVQFLNPQDIFISSR
jgi:prepilin-type N-terminal cleavage/methylation domain-containing protein